jgi:thioredoxin-related protein
MKLLLKSSVAIMALYCSAYAFAESEAWATDFAAAKKQTAESKKNLMINFTGSDWCQYCIKLKSEVFDKDAFKAGVKDKYVLVEIDYPKDKSKQSAETIKQNEELETQYQVSGYPSILLCDEMGKPYAATGYTGAGPEEYVKHLDEIQAKKAQRDESFASASKMEGVAKAKALVAAIEAMELNDKMVSNFYGDSIAEIKKADPEDSSGYIRKTELKVISAKAMEDLNEAAGGKEWATALEVADKTLKVEGLSKEDTQLFTYLRGRVLGELKKFDEAIKALEDAKAVLPTSEMIEQIDQCTKEFQEAKAKPETK